MAELYETSVTQNKAKFKAMKLQSLTPIWTKKWIIFSIVKYDISSLFFEGSHYSWIIIRCYPVKVNQIYGFFLNPISYELTKKWLEYCHSFDKGVTFYFTFYLPQQYLVFFKILWFDTHSAKIIEQKQTGLQVFLRYLILKRERGAFQYIQVYRVWIIKYMFIVQFHYSSTADFTGT